MTVPIIGITRAIANYAPYSPRPARTPGFEINLYDGQIIGAGDGFSSMPSDHASLFMGLGVAFFMIHRNAGIFLILWAIFVSSIPRIILGWHWPYDIAIGWILGASIVLILRQPAIKLIERTDIVPYFESREVIGYPLLFAATFEVARMFTAVRNLLGAVL
ncbi:MAG: phosphatase PAP2 family protein [Pseudomonadota bacterium]